MVAIIDIKGMRLKQITKDFLFLMKNMAGVDQSHYPERMGATYIINCPSMFSIVWRGIAPWINKDTAAKIKILASEKEWRPVLENDIGLDQVSPRTPERYDLCERHRSPLRARGCGKFPPCSHIYGPFVLTCVWRAYVWDVYG